MNIDELVVRITDLAKQGTQSLYKEMSLFGIELVGKIKQDLSSGVGPSSRSGALARSVTSSTMQFGDQIVTKVQAGGATAPYAPIMEDGSRAHMIYPHKQALAFEMYGAPVVVRKVSHPGTQAYHFVSRNVVAAEADFRERAKAAALRGLYGT